MLINCFDPDQFASLLRDGKQPALLIAKQDQALRGDDANAHGGGLACNPGKERPAHFAGGLVEGVHVSGPTADVNGIPDNRWLAGSDARIWKHERPPHRKSVYRAWSDCRFRRVVPRVAQVITPHRPPLSRTRRRRDRKQ